jgi:hypothetical protein
MKLRNMLLMFGGSWVDDANEMDNMASGDDGNGQSGGDSDNTGDSGVAEYGGTEGSQEPQSYADELSEYARNMMTPEEIEMHNKEAESKFGPYVPPSKRNEGSNNEGSTSEEGGGHEGAESASGNTEAEQVSSNDTEAGENESVEGETAEQAADEMLQYYGMNKDAFRRVSKDGQQRMYDVWARETGRDAGERTQSESEQQLQKMREQIQQYEGDPYIRARIQEWRDGQSHLARPEDIFSDDEIESLLNEDDPAERQKRFTEKVKEAVKAERQTWTQDQQRKHNEKVENDIFNGLKNIDKNLANGVEDVDDYVSLRSRYNEIIKNNQDPQSDPAIKAFLSSPMNEAINTISEIGLRHDQLEKLGADGVYALIAQKTGKNQESLRNAERLGRESVLNAIRNAGKAGTDDSRNSTGGGHPASASESPIAQGSSLDGLYEEMLEAGGPTKKYSQLFDRAVEINDPDMRNKLTNLMQSVQDKLKQNQRR